MIRAAFLTLLLIASGLTLILPATAGGFEIESYRNVVLWGIPVVALVLSLVFFPRLRSPGGEAAPGGPRRRRLLLLAGCALAFLADQSFLGFGYLTNQATFTYGSHELADSQLAVTALWALPLCLVLGIWGWERALRGAVYTGWRRALPVPAALSISVLTGLVLALPPILPAGEIRDLPFVAAALTAALCREISFALVFARGGGLLVAGLYRGFLWFVEAFVVSDWYSLYLPSYNYVTGDPLFYAARAASALLGLVVIAAAVRPPPRSAVEESEEEAA